MSDNIPRVVTVRAVKSSRYKVAAIEKDGGRPFQWDDRKAGVDIVHLVEGGEVTLLSEGGQSTPKPGWVLMLTGGTRVTGYNWTLYGIANEGHVETRSHQ